MKKNSKQVIAGKLLSAAVSTSMVLTSMPYNVLASQNGAAILVQDKTGKVISNANVSVDLKMPNGSSKNVSGITDSNGIFDFLLWSEFQDGQEYEYTATVTKDKYVSKIVTGTVNTMNQSDEVVQLEKQVVTGVSVKAKQGLVYNGKDQELISISGIQTNDTVKYYLNDNLVDKIPSASKVGNYTVKVVVSRSGFEDFVWENTVEIKGMDITDECTALGTVNKYDGKNHALVDEASVQPKDGYTVQYSMDNGVTWNNVIPVAKEVGDYIVLVKFEKENYVSKTIKVESTISRGSQEASLDIPTIESSWDFNSPYKVKFSVSNVLEGASVIYSIDNPSIASIDPNTGELTMNQAGQVKVIASVSETAHYDKKDLEHTFVVKAKNAVKFNDKEMDYVFGKDVVSSQKLTLTGISDANATYSLDKKDIGLKIDSATGEVKVDDYIKLASVLDKEQGSIYVNVNAKPNNTLITDDPQSYKIHIKDTDMKDIKIPSFEALDKDKWYQSVTIDAPEGYEIALEKDMMFKSSVEFTESSTLTDEKPNDRYVYLRNKDTQNISKKIILEGLKIDAIAPIPTDISFREDQTIIDKIAGFIFNKKDQKDIEVTFHAKDEISGVASFEYSFVDEDGNNLTGTVTEVKQDSKDKTLYTGIVTLPNSSVEGEGDNVQLRGKIAFTATDKAGNSSELKEDGRIVVIDTVSPELKVSHGSVDAGKVGNEIDSVHYYSTNVEYTIDVTERNFFSDNVKVTLNTIGENNNVTQSTPEVKWQDDSSDKKHHIGKILLNEEGRYSITVEYTDKSGNISKFLDKNGDPIIGEDGNEITSYTSDIVDIDKDEVEPKVGFDSDKQTFAINIKDRNFNTGNVKFTINSVVDITGKTVTDEKLDKLQDFISNDSNWKHEGRNHTLNLTEALCDGVYDISYKYTKRNLFSKKIDEKFTLDRTEPTDLKVSYSQAKTSNVLDTILHWFGGPDKSKVEVTFTAKDITTGVKEFNWWYTKEEGANASDSITGADMKLNAVQSQTDKSVYTATVELPVDEAEQLKGHIAFTATDNSKINKQVGNTSAVLDDKENVLVYDTISPVMDIVYSVPSRVVDKTNYYNSDLEATLVINESNFFAQDVKVEITKDGNVYNEVKPTWTDNSVEVHTGKFVINAKDDHSNDGSYKVRVTYKDRSGNEMVKYVSDTMILDTTAPEIKVEYKNNMPANTLKDNEEHDRKYFDSAQLATVTINERNFNADEVNFDIVAKDINGNKLDLDSLHAKTSWTSKGDQHTMNISYSGDANYTFDVDYTDLATNKAKDCSTDYFTVDKTAPTNLTIDYSQAVSEATLSGILHRFFGLPATVEISAQDNISPINAFVYDYKNAPGVSSVNKELLQQAISEATIKQTGNKAVGTFTIPKEVLTASNQFNGNVSFNAKDRSGNISSSFHDSQRVVVDNISPTTSISFSSPVQNSGGISYYSSTITGTIRVNEANFYAEDLAIIVNKDGATTRVNPTWTSLNTDEHIGTFALSGDGDYFVSVNHTDKSGNSATPYKSNQLTIDTQITEPVLTVNGSQGNGRAFKDKVIVGISMEDRNFESYDATLVRTRYDEKGVNVTSEFIQGIGTDAHGGSGTFDTFKDIIENDGIYTLTVTMRDKAGHSSTSTMTFTVNRYGSVYEYDDYLISLIKDGGAYVQNVKKDLIITEYNPDKLLSNSLEIEISKDGKPLKDVKYDVSPEINENVSVGSSGWYQYRYTISKDNFKDDGIYKISVSSKDATGNTPENNNFKDKEITFYKDSTAPEITSVTGLEETIVNAAKLDVDYTVFDAIGLKSVEVYLDDEKVVDIKDDDLKKDSSNYTGTFVVQEKSSSQNVRMVITDKAGNVTDTADKEFSSAFEYNNQITVSTNFFVRYFANKPLFFGSLVAVVAAGGFVYFIVSKRKKEDEESSKK